MKGYGAKMTIKERRSRVQELLKQGKTAKDIGLELGISESTVYADKKALRKQTKPVEATLDPPQPTQNPPQPPRNIKAETPVKNDAGASGTVDDDFNASLEENIKAARETLQNAGKEARNALLPDGAVKVDSAVPPSHEDGNKATQPKSWETAFKSDDFISGVILGVGIGIFITSFIALAL